MYSKWVHLLESQKLIKMNPLSVLRNLRDHYSLLNHDQKNSIAYFQTSDAKDGTFSPRLTVIGIEPVEIIQCQGGDENPFIKLNKSINEKKIIPHPLLPNFQGGAMGYFSYDSAIWLEPSLLSSSYREGIDAEFIFFRYYIILGHLENKAIILSHENRPEIQSQLAEIERIAGVDTASSVLNFEKNKNTAEIPVELMTPNFGQASFIDGVNQLKKHIVDGDIFQAVLSDSFTHPYSGDSLDLFEILSQLSPAPYHFYISIDDRSYLGASPEMLLKSTKGIIETHPIAGTRPRGMNAAEEKKLEVELLDDEKEKSEHLMLVDLARNDIGRVSEPGTVKVESFQKIKKFGGVMHLVSVVTGKLSSSLTAIEALASCFPAGTLSGAPKIRAMDLIHEIEKKPREFYGGSFVAASLTGDLDSCISIRSISLKKGIATIQAGAGIVADSVTEKEYEEIKHKTKLTRKALAIALKLLEKKL